MYIDYGCQDCKNEFFDLLFPKHRKVELKAVLLIHIQSGQIIIYKADGIN